MNPLRAFGASLKARPLAATIVVTFVAVVAAVTGYLTYHTYDYVQHDNNFCLSCHIMEEAYEEFGRSAHRGLGCKACHQPSIVDRTRMAVTQVVDRPLEVVGHAEVPNERCASCHVYGNPETWESIRNSAGHLAHLNSDVPELRGLLCVECHSRSLHEFTPVDETCGQSGCHDETVVRLGGMGNFTIHCVACHSYNAPVEGMAAGGGASEGKAALRPNEETCLSCHAMRTIVGLMEDDAHQGECASCHNPHDQADPREAVESCGTADCHADALDLTPVHRGLEPEALADCVLCHTAHDFHVEASDCRSCHSGSGPFGRPTPEQTEELSLHSRHVDVDCLGCHESERDHGSLSLNGTADCRNCHHVPPVADLCEACHEASEFPEEPYLRLHRMDFEAGAPRERILPFEHADHTSAQCGACHVDGLSLSSRNTSCAACHEEHHTPDVACRSCHQTPPEEAHSLQVHSGCSGDGCHQAIPFEVASGAREVCLSCHQDQVEHELDRDDGCAECHLLPGSTETREDR